MADDNRPLKYMRYAIGEIVLVVIGILIALSINNWNQEKKMHTKEIAHLQNIKKNIETNIKLLNEQLTSQYININSNKIIREVISNNIAYHDSLSNHFHGALLFPNWKLSYASYESLKSSGFDVINNDKLKNEIIELFEVIYPGMRENLLAGQNAANMSGSPFWVDNFESVSSGAGIIPNNFESLKENQKFINLLSMYENVNNWGIYLKTQSLNESKLLLEHIDDELKRNQ